MTWQRSYDFAYAEAHNYHGVMSGHQLNHIARAFAELREAGHEVATSFAHFWIAWEGGLVEAIDAEGSEWVVLDGPSRHYDYYETEDEHMDRKEVA